LLREKMKRGNGPGLTIPIVLVVVFTSAGSWMTAARHDFSSGWLGVACLVSALGAIGLVRGALRL
jgi:hypothetical protein